MVKITKTIEKTKKIMRRRVLIALIGDAIFIICVITVAAVVMGVSR